MQIAPASPQARPPASVIFTSFQALAGFGVTVTVYRVPDPLTLAVPGATLKEAATGRLPAPGASLSVRSKVNAVPSCSEGNVLERGRQRPGARLLLLLRLRLLLRRLARHRHTVGLALARGDPRLNDERIVADRERDHATRDAARHRLKVRAGPRLELLLLVQRRRLQGARASSPCGTVTA